MIVRAVAKAAFAVAGFAASVAAQQRIAFVDVSVVPMVTPGVLAHRTVVVEGERIVAIDSADARPLGAGTRVIDGRGRYLVPGLTDTHVHLELNERRWMPAFLLYGVTTVFNLRGDPRHLTLRDDVAAGRAVGPRIYTSGPYANLPMIQSADDAATAVAEQKRTGYDFIKIHGNLAPAAFAALTSEGRRLGIPVIGHAPRNLAFDSVIVNRQVMVAHVEEILYTFFRRRDTTGIADLARRMRDADVWLTPNLVAYTHIARQIGRPQVIDSMFAFADRAFLDSGIVAYWRSGVYTNRPLADAPSYDANRQFLTQVTSVLHRGGVEMLAGTDSPLPGIYPGRSLHEELALLAGAGFTNAEALATATIQPGRFVGRYVRPGEKSGGIAVGMRADLLLLEGNPLSDLRTLAAPSGVMANGRWFDAAALQKMRDDITIKR